MYTVLTSHRHPASLIHSYRMARQQFFVLYCIVLFIIVRPTTMVTNPSPMPTTSALSLSGCTKTCFDFV